MIILNLPRYIFRIRMLGTKKIIFDSYRSKWVSLTPEEWVRQNFVRYLTEEKLFPSKCMATECSIGANGQNFRADAIVFDRSGQPLAIIECKAPEVKISQTVFDQIVSYNFKLKVKYLMVTNGLTHYCCVLDFNNLSYSFLPEIPDYNNLIESL